MPLRYGEMVLVVRTQDYASRNLAKISDNIGKLSRIQQLSRRQTQMDIRQARVAQRLSQGTKELGQLRVLQDQFKLQKQLEQVEKSRAKLQGQRAQIVAGPQPRGAGGRFAATPGLGALSAQSAVLAAEEKRLKTALIGTQAAIDRMPPGMARLAASEAEVAARTTSLAGRLMILKREMDSVAADQALNMQATRIASNFDKIHRAGQQISRVGRVLQIFGAVSTVALGSAAKASADFNTQVTRAATQAADIQSKGFADVGAKADRFQQVISDAMAKFPATSQEMADSIYEIFSTFDLNSKKGVQRGIQYFNLFNKAAVGGFSDLKTSTDLGITVLNNFDGAMQNPVKTLNQLFAIIRFGRVDMSRLNAMMVQVAPAAKQANQSLEDISGALAVLSIRVGKAPQAATQFARLLQVFNDPDFQAGLAKAGVKITDVNDQLLPMNEILHKISDAFPGLDQGIGNNRFFQIMTAAGRGSGRGRQFFIQAQRGFTNLITSLDLLDAKQKEITGDQSELGRSVAAGLQSQGVRWKILTNQIHRFVLEVGDAVFPVFERIGKVIKVVTDRFDEMNPKTRHLIGTIVALAAVFSLVGGISAAIIGGLVSLAGTLGIVAARAALAEGAQGILLTTATGLLGVLGRFAALGAIVITLDMVFNKKGAGWKDKLARDALAGYLGFRVGGPIGAVAAVGAVELMAATGKTAAHSFWYNFAHDINSETGKQDVLGRAVGKLGKLTHLYDFGGGGGARDLTDPTKNKLMGWQFSRLAKQHDLEGKAAEATATHEKKVNLSRLHAWEAYYKKQNQFANDSAKYQKELASQIQQAEEQALQSIDQAAQNLTNTFMQFRQANQTAMGELFQGPFLTSETFDLAKEWGITPSIQDINKDMQMMVDRFRKWRGDLTAIGARGAPPGLLKELQALGPDALDKLEVLRKANPKQFAKFVSLWKTSQTEIDKATKIDFTKQLNQWYSYGKSIAQQIIFGLRDGDNVALQEAYKKYIMQNFPNVVAEAKAKAIKDFQAGNVKPPAPPRAPNVPNPNYGSPLYGYKTPEVHYHDHDETVINVGAAVGEGANDVARRAAFVFKNAKRTTKKKKKKPFMIGFES